MKKNYEIKLFSQNGGFKKQLNTKNITSNFNFSENLDGGQGNLNLSIIGKVEDFLTSDIVEIRELDVDDNSPVTTYTGIIENIKIDEYKDKDVLTLELYGVFSILNDIIYKDGETKEFSKSGTIGNLIRDVIDYFNSQYGVLAGETQNLSTTIITYTSSSIDVTGELRTIEFQNLNCLEAIKKILENSQFHFFVNGNGICFVQNKENFGKKYLTFGRELISIGKTLKKNEMVNKYYLSRNGGEEKIYINNTSISTFGLKEAVENNTNIGDETTQDSEGNKKVEDYGIERNDFTLRIKAQKNDFLLPGMLITTQNTKNQIFDLQITKIDKKGDFWDLAIGDYKSVGRTLAKVDSNSSIPPSPAPVPIPADTDYNNLDNKPKINDVELIGNKTLDELNIVKKEDGKGLSSNDFTDGKVQKLEGIEAGANNYVLPSDVVQDNNYIHTDNNYTGEEKTKVANSLVAEDLEDYYTSEEVDTIIEGEVEEINEKLSKKSPVLNAGDNVIITTNEDGSQTISTGGIDLFVIVDELPVTGENNKIYLVSSSSEEGNLFAEYVRINGEWESFGEISIDFSNFYTKGQVDGLISGKTDKTITINGKALNANITLGASDIGLGSVTNDKQAKDADVDVNAVANKIVKRDASGNIKGNYITGTWLQTTGATEKTDALPLAVIDPSGWVYKQSLTALMANLSATSGVKGLNTRIPYLTSTLTVTEQERVLIGTPVRGDIFYCKWATGVNDKYNQPVMEFGTATSGFLYYGYRNFTGGASSVSNPWALCYTTFTYASSTGVFTFDVKENYAYIPSAPYVTTEFALRVPTSRTIAGVPLTANITKSQLGILEGLTSGYSIGAKRDLDTLTINGIYGVSYATSTGTKPPFSSINDFQLLVMSRATERSIQVSFSHYVDEIYMRRRENGVWKNWVKVGGGGNTNMNEIIWKVKNS